MVRTPRKIAPPPELLSNHRRWTERYQHIVDARTGRDWATLTAKQALRSSLRRLAHGKCVFCESVLEVSGDLEVEHYIAKTVAPHLAFEWTSLLPACRLCNRSKGEQDHGNALLKPDVEDPEPYFWIHPDTGRLEPHPSLDAAQRARAIESIRLCDLQRPALCTQRAEMLSRTGRWLELVSRALNVDDTVRDEWEFLSHPNTQYKLVIRHALELRAQHQLSALDRSRFEMA